MMEYLHGAALMGNPQQGKDTPEGLELWATHNGGRNTLQGLWLWVTHIRPRTPFRARILLQDCSHG